MPNKTMPTKDTQAQATATAAPAAETTATAPADPVAGGNYLRDPVTGALSRNPAYPAPESTPATE